MIKKLFFIALAFIAIMLVGIFALATLDFNRLGKETTYVQIVGEGKEEQFTASDGAVYKSYWYTLPAVNEDGEQTEVTFSAQKQLRQEAYLMLYLNKEQEVTSYDEVQLADIPKGAQNILTK